MQSTPDNLDLSKLKHRVEQVAEVKNIHHMHAWLLTDSEIHLEAHVELKSNLKLTEVKGTHSEIEQLLRKDFHIGHVTLQFEYETDHAPHLIHKQNP